jgi:SagB-type dehydrogenase family enzyme
MRLLPIAASTWLLAVGCTARPAPPPGADRENSRVKLPEAARDGRLSLEQTLARRRSVRSYAPAPLTLRDVSQLLWAAQGISEPRCGLRTAPSAGATYPLETLLVAGQVDGLAPGVYRYRPAGHELEKVLAGDARAALADAALGQEFVAAAPASVVFAAVFERTAQRYGARAGRYVPMEAGHAAQNLCLQAVALDLGTVVVGAFRDEQAAAALGLPADEKPLYIVPVGKAAP